MKVRPLNLLLALGFLLLLAAAAASFVPPQPAQAADPPAAEAATAQAAPNGPGPVEDARPERGEYVFQPAYKRLKPAMAAAPAENAGWKVIKSDGLILAEGGNLLLFRVPDEDAEAWKALSIEVRDLGGALYKAGQAKDFDRARGYYEAMIVKCNACHDKFAGGEHQLEP